MGKKTLIISQRQLDEIMGGAYLNTASNDYVPNGDEVSPNTPKDKGGSAEYWPAKKLDDFSQGMANHLGGFSAYFGAGRIQPAAQIVEANSDIQKKTYQVSPAAAGALAGSTPDSVGSNALSNGIDGRNLPEYVHRFREARKEAEMGDPTKLNNMGGPAAAEEVERLYRQAMNQSKTLRNANGNRIKSAPKESGNGKAHTKKGNGIISY